MTIRVSMSRLIQFIIFLAMFCFMYFCGVIWLGVVAGKAKVVGVFMGIMTAYFVYDELPFIEYHKYEDDKDVE